MVGESTEAVGAGVGGGSSGQKMPTLEEYGTNLTKLAEEVFFFLPFGLLYCISELVKKTSLSIFFSFCRENSTQLLADRTRLIV
jgi:hypothetical protein